MGKWVDAVKKNQYIDKGKVFLFSDFENNHTIHNKNYNNTYNQKIFHEGCGYFLVHKVHFEVFYNGVEIQVKRDVLHTQQLETH